VFLLFKIKRNNLVDYFLLKFCLFINIINSFIMNKKISLFLVLALVIIGGLMGTMNAQAAVTTLSLTTPDGGEFWGGSRNVTWTTDGLVSDVINIFHCLDGNCADNQVWIASTTANALSYSWNTTGAANGSYKVKISNPVSFVEHSSNAVFTVDNTKPTSTGTTTAGTLGSNSWYTTDVEFTITEDDALSGASSTAYCVAATDDCDPGAVGVDYTDPITLSSAGNNYVRWATTDNAGNVQVTQTSGLIKIDKVNPVVDAGTDFIIKASQLPKTLAATVSDATSLVATYAWTQVSGTGTVTFSNAAIEDGVISAVSEDGTYGLLLTVTDNAGNVNTDTVTFVYDSTAPTITSATIVGATVEGGSDSVVIHFSEAVSPASNWPAAFDSIISGGVYLDFSSTTGNFSYVNTGGGDHILTLTLLEDPTATSTYLRNGNTVTLNPKVDEIRDVALNTVAITPAVGTELITGDVTAPTVALTYSPDATTYKFGDLVTVTATFNESIHETVLPTIAIDSAGVDADITATNMTRTSNTTYTYVWAVPSGENNNGTSTITIAATDLAGNANATATNNTKQVDNTIPTITSVVGTTVAGAGDVIVISFSETVHLASNWPAAFDVITSGGVNLNFASTTRNFTGTVLTMTLPEDPTATSTYLRNGNTVIVTPLPGEIHDVANNYVAITPVTSAVITGNDVVSPTVALTYSPNTNSYVAGAVVRVIATFNESMFDTANVPHIAISTLGDGDTAATDMTRTSNTVWYYDWTVPSGADEDGLATFTISNATDLAGNASTAATNNTKTIDAVPSIVDSFTAGSIASTSATLTVLTNKISTCSYSNIDESFANMGIMSTTTNATTHTQALTGLSASTRYDYYVRCQDNSGNTMVSSAHVTFVTSAPPEPDAELAVVTNLRNTGVTNGEWNSDGSAGDAYEWVFGITLPNDEGLLALQFSDWTNGLDIDTGVMRYWSEQVEAGDPGSATNPVLITAADTYPANISIGEDSSDLWENGGAAGLQTNIHVQLQIPGTTPAGSHSSSFKIQTEPSTP
jgi:hypothetical protein